MIPMSAVMMKASLVDCIDRKEAKRSRIADETVQQRWGGGESGKDERMGESERVVVL